MEARWEFPPNAKQAMTRITNAAVFIAEVSSCARLPQRTNADYDVETLTADVMHVLDAIARPVILIGASMGGLTGILVADRAGPERVTRLILVDVIPRFRRTAALASATSCSADCTVSPPSTRPPTPSPTTSHTGNGRAARRD